MQQKILLINQHSSNHGDEAAGKALISSIGFSNSYVSILYNTISEKAIIDFGIKFQNTLLTKQIGGISKFLLLTSFFVPVRLISPFFYKQLKDEYKLIERHDIIINMPGGANIGLYQDWRYLWRLYIAIKLKKKVAIYSTSIGPFKDNVFKRLSKYVLSNVDFLSLRDAQSFRIADEMRLKYIKSIDTAFLTQPIDEKFDLSTVGIPFKEKDYVVFVPNNLTAGHLIFKHLEPNKLDDIYTNIVNQLLKYNKNIVFLPQLFANGNDRSYIEKLISNFDPAVKAKFFVVDENFSSDIQQNIVRKSSFVIGARYHSIIFSINNNIPFLCLSYENKMKNTLEILGMEDFGLDLTDVIKAESTSWFKHEIANKLKLLLNKNQVIGNENAKKIATDCFNVFKKSFLNSY